jgi:tetratricopeptide (TPR) repeat protein
VRFHVASTVLKRFSRDEWTYGMLPTEVSRAIRTAQATAVAAMLVVFAACCTSARTPSASTKPPTSPRAIATLLNTALKEHVQGKTDDALSDYKAVIAADPGNEFAYYNVGLIYQTRKQWSNAETEYRLALGINERYAPALYNFALLRSHDGDTSGAIALYRQAVASSPRYANAHFNLGLLLLTAGKAPEGRAEIVAAVKFDPSLSAKAAAQGITTGTK